VNDFVTFTAVIQGPFSGCQSLDISGNDEFIDKEKLMSLWICHDIALRHLNISSLDYNNTVPSLLDAITGMSQDLLSLSRV